MLQIEHHFAFWRAFVFEILDIILTDSHCVLIVLSIVRCDTCFTWKYAVLHESLFVEWKQFWRVAHYYSGFLGVVFHFLNLLFVIPSFRKLKHNKFRRTDTWVDTSDEDLFCTACGKLCNCNGVRGIP